MAAPTSKGGQPSPRVKTNTGLNLELGDNFRYETKTQAKTNWISSKQHVRHGSRCPGQQEAEAGRSASSRPAWSEYQVLE